MKRVLAVDDSRTIRDLLCLALREGGFDPHCAEDGLHGLEIIETVDPHVIITDINMPRLDGFGFIERVRRHVKFSQTPILALTTETAPALRARARDLGATGWIVKPFVSSKLIRALSLVT